MEKTGIQKTGFRIIIILLIIAGGFSYLLRFTTVKPDKLAEFEQIPHETEEWQGEEILFSATTYEILKATSTTLRTYSGPDNSAVSLFIGYFEDQKYGSQIHSPRHCLPGGGWGILAHLAKEIEINSRDIPINWLIIGDRDLRQLMYYWFETRSGYIRNEFALKFDLVKNALLMRPTDAAFVRLTVAVPPGRDLSYGDEILKDFLEEFYPEIENSLPFKSR